MNSRKCDRKKFIWAAAALFGIYGILNALAKRGRESEHIDAGSLREAHGKRRHCGECLKTEASFYEKYIKRIVDKGLSFAGMVMLAPVYGLIALAIVIDDPGPVLFTQKRVGKNNELFMLHKFRSMKMSTPHDVPTHQLENPEQYITRTGKFLRKYSLDELPQIWDIFRGKMSIIGPRPALWNQDDLVAERDKYGANDILPGLTGWAQINGRDELEIADKARLDGEYVKRLQQGGVKALFFDAKCFFGTFLSVIGSKGVVEGGTGELNKTNVSKEAVSEADAGFEEYGYLKHFDIDTSDNNKKRVLITGTGSYIGESFEKWAKRYYSVNFVIDALDMLDPSWRAKDFSSYDVVFHVAGIAHADVGKVSEEEKKKYYAVNTDLAIETAEKAKAEGVKQFILMSSMIIYGDSAPYGKEKVIDEHTLPAPANFYGDSKWQADKRVRALADDRFRVAVLRPPMIYGKGSKGNYPVLAKLAKKLPVFPDVENRRSMLYIDNLCEFLCKLMLSGEGGVYFPQNSSYTKTSDMVRKIREATDGKIRIIRILNPAVMIGSRMSGRIGILINKAFGNAVYDSKLSIYDGIRYQVADLEDSIVQTESYVRNKWEKENKKSSVLFLVNHDVVIYNFRLELVERLLNEGYDVHISSPYGERIDDLIAIGARYHEISIDRHGMNPVREISILKEYERLIKEVNPVIVLGYTIKPNIYGAIAARHANTPFVANITGLGTAVESGGWKQKVTVALYKLAFTDVQRVYFQNEENEQFFRSKHIAVSKHALLPGSGVNLVRYPLTAMPYCGDGKSGTTVKFAFISRIMKEKGIEQYLEAAERIKTHYPAVEFHVCGFCEEEYDGRLDELSHRGIVIYHGMIRDVAEFMNRMHCIVHPTYYPEGLSNVLLEAGACGRAIITTDRAGCREVVKDNGYLIPEKNTEELVEAIKRFIGLTQEEKVAMGIAGRRLVEEKFDRRIVVDKYMDEIQTANKNKFMQDVER